MSPNAQTPRSAPAPPPFRCSSTGTGAGNSHGYTSRIRTPSPQTSSRAGTGAGNSMGYTSRIRTPPPSPLPFNPINLEEDNNYEEDIEANNDENRAEPATAPPADRGRPRSAPLPRQRRRQQAPLRSTAGHRAVPIANPVVDTEIIVGTWRQSLDPLRPNAVIARFDRRGRLNYRVVARTMNDEPLPATIRTSTSVANIILRSPYAGLSPDELRILLDRHMRMSPERRP